MASSCPDGTVATGTAQTPSTPGDIGTIKTAFEAFIGTLSGYKVTTSGADYTVVGPDDDSDGRYLFGFSASKTINAAQKATAYVTTTTDIVRGGFSFDSTDADITNPWDGAANPFGAADFSGFVGMSAAVTGNAIVSVLGGAGVEAGSKGAWLDSVFSRGATAYNHTRIGAGISQYSDADTSVEGTTKRVYMIMTTQAQVIAAAWAAQINTTFVQVDTNDSFQTIVLVSGTWTKGTAYATRLRPSGLLPKVTSSGVWMPVPFDIVIGANVVGRLRNTGYGPKNKYMMESINDGDGSPTGFALNYASGAYGDALHTWSGAS